MKFSGVKEVPISWEESCSGKWQRVSLQSGQKYATVTYKNGEIDPCSYTTEYRRKHNL